MQMDICYQRIMYLNKNSRLKRTIHVNSENSLIFYETMMCECYFVHLFKKIIGIINPPPLLPQKEKEISNFDISTIYIYI